jgi:hypothetical protein
VRTPESEPQTIQGEHIVRRYGRLAAAFFSLLSAFIALISPRAAEAVAVTNACKSNATSTYSDLSLSLNGTAAPAPATVGTDVITLSGVTFQADVPATLLVAGYNLGLLTLGANNIPVKGWVSIQATNTAEGSVVRQFTTSVTTTIADPNGIPGTGDETATPLAVTVDLAESTWTPLGGVVHFRQGGSIPTIPAGVVAAGATTPAGSIFINAQVADGLIKANFDCSPGTTNISPPGGTSGPTFTPATPGDFETVEVIGGEEPTTTSSSSTTTTTTTTTVAPSTTPTTEGPPPPITGTLDYASTCKNNVDPTTPSEILFTASGVTPSKVKAGETFVVTDQKWKVTVPASILQAGIGLGALTPGTPVNGLLTATVNGDNTKEVQASWEDMSLPIPVAVDAEGKALPAVVEFTLPDRTWTALMGNIRFRFVSAKMTVNVPPLGAVIFACNSNTTNAYLQTEAVGTTDLAADPPTTPPPTTAATATTVASSATIPTTGAGLPIIVQIAFAMLIVDIGYLVLSLRRKPRYRR